MAAADESGEVVDIDEPMMGSLVRVDVETRCDDMSDIRRSAMVI
jgi:hypothetical protein